MKRWQALTLIGIGFLFSGASVLAAPITPGSFSTTWNTENPGTSASNQITIPTQGGGYNYTVYWEEVSNPTNNGSSTGNVGPLTITFSNPGIYRVDITGDFPRFSYGGFTVGDARKIITIEQWGSIAWTSMEDAFRSTFNLELRASDTPDLSGVTSLKNMFANAAKMNTDISSWDVSTINTMQGLFAGAVAFNQPLGTWDVSNVTDMSDLFQGATTFNQPLLSWDVSNVIELDGIFRSANAFNQNISNWDTAQVTDMSSIFYDAESFNQPLNTWDVSQVVYLDGAFNGARNFNQPLSSWNTQNVTSLGEMFKGATAFNQDISSWDVSHVESMRGMFNNARSFNQPLNPWNVSNVTDMGACGEDPEGMFAVAIAFNQPLNNWNVSSVTNMSCMFFGAESFNQPLGNWNISNVSSVGDMFTEAVSFLSTTYSETIVGWSARTLPANLVLGVIGDGDTPTPYCTSAQAARDVLVTTRMWDLTDGGPIVCATAELTRDTSSGTRLEGRQVASSEANGNIDTVIQSVEKLIVTLTSDQADIQNFPAEEKKKLVLLLQVIVMYLMTLIMQLPSL